MRRIKSDLTALIFLSWVLVGCGLPTVTYLYPPIDMTLQSNIIKVHNDSRNYEASEASNQTYKGIEIFYRVFHDATTASANLTALGSLADSYSSDPESFIAIATNNTYQFLRLRSSKTKSAPLLALDAADDNDYYLNLNSTEDWTLTDSSNNSVFTDGSTIIRNLDTSTSDTSFYLKNFMFGDDDFNGSTINAADIVYIVFFAVSYGVDQTTVGQTVYSLPYIPSNYVSY